MSSLLINFHDEKRLPNLMRILEVESEFDIIKEVLVWNNNPTVEVKFDHPKVKIINSNFDVGLRARWLLGSIAKHNCLFVQDDDILLNYWHFDILHSKFELDRHRVYGIFGRNLNFFNRYELTDLHGPVDFVLTRLACFNKTLIPYIMEFENNIDKKFLDYPIDDITLSSVSKLIYCKMPYSVDVSGFHYENLQDHDKGLHSKSDFNDKRTEYIAFIRRHFFAEITAKLA